MTKARDLANGGFGLVLIKPSSVVGGTDNGKGTVTISGTSVSLNGVFTSTYTNYRIECSNLAGGNFMTFRFRLSGSDDSSSNYRFRSYRGSVGGPGGDDTSQYSSSTTSFQTIYLIGSPDNGSCSIEVYSPQLAIQKQVSVVGFDAPSNGYTVLSGGRFVDATKQFDGFTLINGSGFSGQVSVYGYNK